MARNEDSRLPRVNELPANLVLMVLGKALAQAYEPDRKQPLPPALTRIVEDLERRGRHARRQE
jgi:hypothetical protein